ncbi:pyridoxamine 5'-phosphate oxidase family protein [Ensifer sp. BR816]|jgi:nitroimidazol reductase NimA-like FMN-containing flavoprotein (pyridoxamine 5'-phosphate oxidase superfamily)|uniref:pyridoxamine 5'-phosphate oxidase family protein n=1 Tax=Rhizobium sp. (strain BR816) TaxID=1057002 RepID=UPI0003624A74|nr:pyridoxamine 5'-phosphate oxidase family protein [Ensifer sp. BR816]
MLIREMTEQECTAVVASARLARLACSKDGRPYVVPIHYAYAGRRLYSFSMPGRKIDWMRANPHVCVQIDAFSGNDQWKSVLLYGQYQELPETAQWHHERLHAWSLLQDHINWWEPGGLKPAPQETLRASPHLFYCICVDEMTGRAAVAEDLRAARLS